MLFFPNFFQILKSQHPTAKIHWGPSVSVICTVCQNHNHHYHPTAVLSASQGLTEQLKTCKQFQNGEYLPQIANSTHTVSHLTTPGGLTLLCLNQLDQQAHERGERNCSPRQHRHVRSTDRWDISKSNPLKNRDYSVFLLPDNPTSDFFLTVVSSFLGF